METDRRARRPPLRALPLDILVGNLDHSGVLSPVGHIDPPVWDKVFAINDGELAATAKHGRPLPARCRARDVRHPGAARTAAAPFWSAYAASKSALETLVKAYAAEVATFGVRANLIDPGVVRTDIRAQAFRARS